MEPRRARKRAGRFLSQKNNQNVTPGACAGIKVYGLPEVRPPSQHFSLREAAGALPIQTTKWSFNDEL
jgi:hypothetical protein